MGQQRALEVDQLDVLVLLERGPMLRLLVRRVAFDCNRAGLTQRLGGALSRQRMVHSRMDTPRAGRASVSRVLHA
jgi:hypothetical protein